MIVLLVITDGRREYVAQTIPSAMANLQGSFTRAVVYDDSGDPDNEAWLAERFGHHGFEVISHPQGRQGFGGAIRAAWAWLRLNAPEPFIFHLEDDFTFNRPVDVDAMAGVLTSHPYLAQMALRRQPWNDAERAAGGIIDQHPRDYAEVTVVDETRPLTWLEHRRFFTTNPCLYRRELIVEHDWPDRSESEGHFTHHLLAHGFQFGYWGGKASGEAVHHVGHQRTGVGY